MITGGKLRLVGLFQETLKDLVYLRPKYGSAGKPAPGYDVRVLRTDGSEAKPGEMGDILC